MEKCSNCGNHIKNRTVFSNMVFCSASCRDVYTVSHNEKICRRCNTLKHISEFGKNHTEKCGYSIYCKQCTHEMQHTHSYPNPYTVLRQDVLNTTGGKCYLCGSKHNINVHHIIPRTRGGKDIASNLVPLCRECHRKAHNNTFSNIHGLNELLSSQFKTFASNE